MKVPLNITVRSTELDAYGHVNNAKYLEYIEWGRFAWFEASQLPEDLFGSDAIAVVVSVNINYRKESKLGEALRVDTSLVHLGDKSFRFAQEVVGLQGDVRADALVTAVAFSPSLKRAVPVPQSVRETLARHLVS